MHGADPVARDLLPASTGTISHGFKTLCACGAVDREGQAHGPARAPAGSCTKTTIQRVYAREQGGGTPDRTADAPERATREIRSPQVITLHRKPGARWSSRDQRTDTRQGKAVDSCGQRGAVPRLSTAVGRRPTGCTELARCAGPGLRPRRPFPLHLTNTADAGPELTQTVACAGAGVLDDSCGALPEHRAGPGQRSVPVFAGVGRDLGEVRGTMIRCLRRDLKLALKQSIIN